MRTEVDVATRWWAVTLREHISSASASASASAGGASNPNDRHTELQARVDVFERELKKAMAERYSGHWYRQDPERGHAFRSIALDKFQLDPLLALASRRAKLSTRLVHSALLNCPLGELVMFVDPFCVSVQQRTPRVAHLLHQDTDKLAKYMPQHVSQHRGRGLSASEQLLVARQHFARATLRPQRTFTGMSMSPSLSDEENGGTGKRQAELLFTVQRPRASVA